MDLLKAEGYVYPQEGQPFDPTQISKAVSDAGFTAAEILITIAGTVAEDNEILELYVSGLQPPFTLSGGPQYEALQMRADVVGKKVRLTGKLTPLQGAGPPGLTIEAFDLQP